MPHCVCSRKLESRDVETDIGMGREGCITCSLQRILSVGLPVCLCLLLMLRTFVLKPHFREPLSDLLVVPERP